MDKKGISSTTALPLFVLTLLTASLIGVSAVPISPYIMIVPEKTLDPTLTPGNTYIVSIYTDYTGSDIWSWQFELTFNPAVLQGVTVTNGDLITTIKDPSAVFVSGTFDNTLGQLSLTYAFFDYSTPPAPTTSGPGTLAYVEFTVIGYGSTDLTLVEESGPKLMDPVVHIIDGYMDPDNIGHGYFKNKLTGDADGDGTVNVFDILKVKNHWYPGPPAGAGGYERNVDCDDDGSINVFDILIVKANWGRSI